MAHAPTTPHSPAAALDDQHRVPSLDGLRGIAILLVIAFHLRPEIAPGGALGVDVFFVLSGFLITSILLQEWRRSDHVELSMFYLRRAGRLLPALVLFLLVVAPLGSIALGTADQMWSDTLMTLFYVSDFARAVAFPTDISFTYAHSWSLAVEEQFYLVWPFVLILALRRGWSLVRFGTVLWLGGVAATLVTSQVVGPGQDYFLPTGHVHALAIGCLVAFVVRPGYADAVRSRWFAGHPLAVAVLVLLAVSTVVHRETWPSIAQPLSNIALGVGVAALIAHCTTGHSTTTRLLALEPLRWFGQRSYALYLFHPVLMTTYPQLGLGRTAASLLGLLASLVLAELSFRLVEAPVLARVRAWIRAR